MQPASEQAVIVAAAVVMFVGFLVPSPSGAFSAFGLAALLAVVTEIFGTRIPLRFAMVLLLCSIGLAANKYPDLGASRNSSLRRI